jgi:predicted P-loop ATPase
MYDLIPNGQPTISALEVVEKSYPQPKKIKTANQSLFERTEKMIADQYDLRYNEVSNEIEYREKGQQGDYKTMNENNLLRFLRHNGNNLSSANLSALLNSDFVPIFNPFKDYFENLGEWNEISEPDYIGEIGKYIIAKEPERFMNQLKKHLVRCVACSIVPGYFNKHALVLIDRQNTGKSTLTRWFCPPVLKDYIGENVSTDKDGIISLADNFIINLDELATMSRADINALKSMFSKDKIKIRRPFAKRATVAPRRASFFGSTDRDEFLTDEAGSVRWLCFLIEKIIWDYKKAIDINNVWRQACSLFKNGFKYDLTKEEIKENERINQIYRVSTPEVELISKFFSPGTKEDYDLFYSASEIMQEILVKFPFAKLNHVSIGKAMKTLGFLPSQARKEEFDYPVKGYYLKKNI